ncbi:MAG TPA: helix-hairpin-helix domain-containing protein [Actinomycetota bacterium]|nr:helix-hairpin-helix domain-containing protein [Actinomycetota bacterium]
MPEISPPLSWRDAVDGVGGKRRDLVLVAGVVAAIVFSGLAISARGSPPRIAPPAIAAEPHTDPSATPSGGVVVHVAGAVREPGVVTLPPGARVADAIALAGGALRRADLDGLNLAAPVVDGAQILVPDRAQQPAAVAVPSAVSTQGALVNINTADQALLETIPGIGPVTASAILEHRTSIGSFESLEQLLDVTGIGPATLESMRAYITL